jgi:hypothetical protein
VLLDPMIEPVVDLQLTRHQWAAGSRALERRRDDRRAYETSLVGVEAVERELTGRVGQTFTLEQIAAEYARSDRWVLQLLEDTFPESLPPDGSTLADAAFDRFSRHASDYRP